MGGGRIAPGLQVQANGTSTSTVYDASGRLVRIRNLDAGGSVVGQFEYRSAAAGRRTRVVELSGDRVTWSYDAAGQVVAERRSGAQGYATTFVYDPAGSRTREIAAGERTTAL